jgi:hypothetical protein
MLGAKRLKTIFATQQMSGLFHETSLQNIQGIIKVTKVNTKSLKNFEN